jgi:hypothetical protein
MNRIFALGASALLFCASAATAEVQPTPAEVAKAEVLQMEKTFSAYSEKMGPAKAWHDFFDEKEGHLFSSSGLPAIGAEAVYEAMGGDAESPVTLTWATEKIWVANSGDMATTWGKWVSQPKTGGAARTGQYVTVWHKDGQGKWKVLVDIGNSNAPPAP